MSDHPDPELLEIFRQEASAALEKLGQALVQLEGTVGQTREKRVREIFRLAHTLKGAASTVGRQDLTELAHALETRLDRLRKGLEEAQRELIDASLGAVDALTEGLDVPLPPARVQAVVERLVTGMLAAPTAPRTPTEPPAAQASGPTQGLTPVGVSTPGAQPNQAVSPGQADSAIPASSPAFDPVPAGHPQDADSLLTQLMVELSAVTQGQDAGAARNLAQSLLALPILSQGDAREVALALASTLGALKKDALPPREIIESSLMAVDFLLTAVGPKGPSREEANAVLATLAPGQKALTQAATLQPKASGTFKPFAPVETGATPSANSSAQAPSVQHEATVRIPVALLDTILYQLDELGAVRQRMDYQRRQIEDAQEVLDAHLGRARAAAPGLFHELESHKRALERIRRNVSQETHQLGLISQEIQESVKEVRMVPLGPLLNSFRRTVRDLAHRLGKEASLEVEGDDVRVDKQLLELMRDPLTHLLRNAVDHGLETPEERQAAGKARAGRIRITAQAKESQVWLEVRDDGRGISTEKLRRRAVERGLLDVERAAALTDRETLNLIFEPGFSTAEKVSEVSGRGVGLDVVRENVASMGGRIEFFSTLGRETEFKLCLPLTLAGTSGLVVGAGGHQYCIPLMAVEEVLSVEPEAVGAAQGRLALEWRKQAVSFFPLEELLAGIPSQKPTVRTHAVLLALSDRRLAIGVSEIFGQEEVMVKGLVAGTPRLPFVAGATSLADGRLVTVLEPTALVDAAMNATSHAQASLPHAAATVLVADDSLTSRTLIASVLERAGYHTLTAHDGPSALSLASHERVDLVVSDVEMPGMDGFLLVQQLRSGAKTSALPCILVTSLGSSEERARGAAAGADGYLVKKDFEPARLLGMINDLLQRPTSKTRS